jgi:O-antigen/teichoic acid export membrane protein
MKNQGYTSIHHILKYIGVFGGVEVLKTLANLSRGKITASFLGPFGTGLIAIYQNILDVIRSCTNIGLETASIQQLSEINTQSQHQAEVTAMAKVIRTWSMAMALLDVVVCLIVAILLGDIFFNDGNAHRTEILMLVPAAFMAPIAAGECAILKGTHKLKRVAVVELLGAIGTVICTLSIYWIWGLSGIIPALNLCIATETLIHLLFCIQIIPYRINLFSAEVWKRGIPLLKFGIPYAATAIMGAITTTLLYKIISSTDNIAFYKTGYALIMYYIGIVFSSNATDYFPRLTSVCHDNELKTETVNKQIHVSFTLTTPLVMTFLLAMPIIILTLYTEDFMPMASICIMAGLFQLHRSVALPLEYVSLAHGHSWMFLILESIYNILIISSVYALYNIWGLPGIGLALSLVGIANTFILSIINYCYYHIRITHSNLIMILIGSGLVTVIIILCNIDNIALRFGIGIPLTLLTTAYCYRTLKKGITNEA